MYAICVCDYGCKIPHLYIVYHIWSIAIYNISHVYIGWWWRLTCRYDGCIFFQNKLAQKPTSMMHHRCLIHLQFGHKHGSVDLACWMGGFEKKRPNWHRMLFSQLAENKNQFSHWLAKQWQCMITLYWNVSFVCKCLWGKSFKGSVWMSLMKNKFYVVMNYIFRICTKGYCSWTIIFSVTYLLVCQHMCILLYAHLWLWETFQCAGWVSGGLVSKWPGQGPQVRFQLMLKEMYHFILWQCLGSAQPNKRKYTTTRAKGRVGTANMVD